MKKIFLMLALFSASVIGANAQIATENSNALDNISVGVTVGASTPLDFNSILPLNPNVGLKIQKAFTPAFAIQAEGLAILNDNHFTDVKTAVKATNVGANAVFNLSNIFGGYNGTPRVFEVSTVTGIGWLHTWNTSVNNLSAKTGLDLAFNLGTKKAVSIVVTPAVYWDLNKFGDMQFNKHNSQLAVDLTFVYHFKTSNGTRHFKTYDIGAMIGEINRLNGALEECEKRGPVEKTVEKIVEKIVEVPATVPTVSVNAWTVTFDTNSAVLTNEAKSVLSEIGENTIVDIVASANKYGTEGYNKVLSQKRADAVAKFLTERGIKVNSADGIGVSEKGRLATIVTVQ